MLLADKIALIIFYVGLSMFFVMAISGKVNKALFFLIPLFPLQNIIERFQQFPLGKDFTDILLIGMLIGWVVDSSSKKNPLLIKTPFNGLFIFMILFTYFALWKGAFFLGLPAPINPSDFRVQFWKNCAVFPLLFFLVVNNLNRKKDIKILAVLMACSILISGYYTFKQISWMSGLASRNKLNGTFMWLGPNEVAAFFASYAFVFFGVFLTYKKKIIKFFYLAVFLLSMYCVLFLFSRGSYLGVLMGFLFIAFTKQKKLIIPILLLLMFWQVVLPKEVVERINETESENHQLDASSEKRLIMWEQSIQLFKENVIFGAGLVIFPYMKYELGDTHNVYVKILAEQGLIGIFIILMIFWKSILEGWGLFKQSSDGFFKGLGFGFVACVISLVIVNFFGDRWTHIPVGTFFWVFLGLVVKSKMIDAEESSKSTAKVALNGKT